jgi:hypothetical protein
MHFLLGQDTCDPEDRRERVDYSQPCRMEAAITPNKDVSLSAICLDRIMIKIQTARRKFTDELARVIEFGLDELLRLHEQDAAQIFVSFRWGGTTMGIGAPKAHRQSELSALDVKPLLVAYAMCHMRAAGYLSAFTFSGPLTNWQVDSLASG